MSNISTAKKSPTTKVKTNEVTTTPIQNNPSTGKDSNTAWGLWLLFGLIGGHRYYLNRKGTGLVMTLLVLLTAGYGLIITIPWMLFDIAKINKWLAEYQPSTAVDAEQPTLETIPEVNEVSPVTTPIPDEPVIEVVTRANKPNIVKLQKDLYSFIVLDLETTGLSAASEGITQVSALKYVDNIKVAQFNKYVNPEHEIPKKVQFLTRITPEMVVNEPTFGEIIPELHEFIAGLPIIGHNVNFDINFITTHGYTDQQIFIEDTITIARKKLPELENYKLEILKNHYGITNQSHNSLDDCETTAFIYQQMRDGSTEKIIASDLVESTESSDKLTGLRFCITGQFMDMTRSEIKFLIEQNGGRVTSAVSGLTDYLVDGEQVYEGLSDGVHSSAELKAQEFIDKGGKIKIIGLDELNQLVA
ncbi:exonuclease domain-containing protein [Latilactobacillus sakei]|uniref:exonuclease domain-containing protein n=1 Tax=Latilactobacillus sakei TaxID=1599 RepID=UPI003F5329F1